MAPRIVLLIGLPGSGKSTWWKRQRATALSSDAIRLLLTDDETDQTIHGRVFATMRFLLRQRLEIGQPVTYIDATHLRPWERRPYFKVAERYGAKVEAVFFDVSLAECKRRNRRRKRKVPEEAMDRLAARLVPPARSEGFARITRISGAARVSP